LVLNTVTNILTFLMVFIIQNTQKRDATAIQLKLNEVIRAMEGARTGLVDLENLSEENLQKLKQQFERLREQHGEASDAFDQQIAEVEEEQEEREATGAGSR
jgi:low affinity Fe/Cu permease